MKKIQSIFLIMTGILVFFGCSDFLDVPPRGSAIAQSVEDYNGMFNVSSLSILSTGAGESYHSFWKSDEHLFPSEYISYLSSTITQPQGIINAIQYKDKVFRDDQISPEWTTCYVQIYTYNAIANGVMSATGSDLRKKYLQAEARVSRAYMHFLLGQWFAMPYKESTAATELAVPVVTEANTQVFDFKRATVAELYNFILSEMETYCPQLEERRTHRGRVYKATGYALYGKVCWMMGKYEQAITQLSEAMRLLQNDPIVYFYDYNQEQAAYGYKEVPAKSMSALMPYTYNNHEALFCKQSSLSIYSFFEKGMPVPYLKPEIYNLFDEHDLRRNLICTVNVSGVPLAYPYSGYSSLKSNLGVDLAEVYLMLAESEARAGSEAKARNLLLTLRANRIRTGHETIPATVLTREDLIRFCVDEQTREFIASGHRWYNIRRLWNDPLFQSIKPVTHSDGTSTYTLQEAQLKLEIPETVLIWNENWR